MVWLDSRTIKCKNDSTAKNRMQSWVFFILIGFGIWLLIISFFLYRVFSFFKGISQGVEVKDIKSVLENALSGIRQNGKEISAVKRKLGYLEEQAKFHVQKVGLVRFNPFRELGGDHSFSLAILDAENNGIIITSLHTRDRTRVYMKDIKKGRGTSELSAEEKRALSQAEKSR